MHPGSKNTRIASGFVFVYICGKFIIPHTLPGKEIMMRHSHMRKSLLLTLFAAFVFAAAPASFAAPSGPEQLIGKAAPDFTLKDISGKEVAFSQFKGKPVLLEFWATWCPYCVEVLPGVEKIYKEFGPKGLEVVAVSLDTKEKAVTTFLKEKGYSMPVLMDDGKMLKRFNAKVIPTVFLIDRTGVIRMCFVNYGKKGQAQVEAEVGKLIEK